MLNSQSVLRNDVLFSTVRLRFVLSRVCVFLYSLGPRSKKLALNIRDGVSFVGRGSSVV